MKFSNISNRKLIFYTIHDCTNYTDDDFEKHTANSKYKPADIRHNSLDYLNLCIYSVSQTKIPPKVFWHFFPNCYEFFVQILHACYTFLSMLDY